MISAYIVVEGGCIRYVSADGYDVNITVVDLDDMREAPAYEKPQMEVDLAKADSLLRVW